MDPDFVAWLKANNLPDWAPDDQLPGLTAAWEASKAKALAEKERFRLMLANNPPPAPDQLKAPKAVIRFVLCVVVLLVCFPFVYGVLAGVNEYCHTRTGSYLPPPLSWSLFLSVVISSAIVRGVWHVLGGD